MEPNFMPVMRSFTVPLRYGRGSVNAPTAPRNNVLLALTERLLNRDREGAALIRSST
jgi:hypothetical protein